MDRYSLGKAGERAVVTHLILLGYEILKTNYRCRAGEVDIIARDGEALVFIEVKTRSFGRGDAMRFGQPKEKVGAQKINRLKTVACHYISKHYPRIADGEISVRFDIASVIKKGNEFTVDIIHGACI